jgi:osmotically-inducible protein OsmY
MMKMIRGLFFILILSALALGAFYFYQGGELPVIGESLGDAKISTSVKAALALHQDLAGRPVSVRTRDAVVTLSGRVGSDDEKAAAGEVAESVDGVRRVDNLIAVTPELGSRQARSDRSLGQKLDDTALATKVKGAFALHRDLRHLDIRVEAREGKIFLEGQVATPAQAETARTRALTIEGVVDIESRLVVTGEAEAGGDLATRIESVLADNDNLRAYRLRVYERDNSLVLEGEVATGAERELAQLLAERSAGGREIRNEILIRN